MSKMLSSFVLLPLLFFSTVVGADNACEFWRAEMLRRQMDERGEATNTAYDADALGNLKHKPFLRVEGTTAIVVVGIGAVTGIASDLVHPMVNSTDTSVVHWIDTIWVEDQAGKIIGMRRLSVTEPAPATLTFQIPAGTTQMTAFEHCNKHGAFKGQMLTIDAVQTVPNLQPQCSISLCRGWTSDAAACSSPITEYERLYSSEFSRTTAVDGNTNLKHKPSLTVHGNGSATVVVGQENVKEGTITYHPMAPSTDPTFLHWINAIWVLDQSGLVIANYEFLPDAIGPASLTFEVPAGTTEMTAYEYCNKHGLFVGDETAVAGSSTSGNSEASCSATACPREAVNFAQAADCLALVADANRRQALENGRSPLVFLMPYNLGSDNEKHNPYIVLDGNVAKVVIGKGAASGDASDPVHPMVGDPSSDGANMHFIETIWVEDQSGQILSYRSLSPSEPSPAMLYFDIPVGTTSVRAYEYCNIHGLFQGAAVPVTPANTRAGARSGCSPQQCIEGSSVSACQASTAELQRREGGSSAKDDPSGKHKPYLWIDGTTATIVVGQGATPGNVGGLIHPMSPSNETDLVHFISYVYAEDDLQNLVALCELLPTDPAPATCTFQVPPGITSLRPYEFCNKHGLYVGEIAQVASSNATATRQCHKRECTESQPSLAVIQSPSLPTGPTACEFWRAEMLRRQMDERGEATNTAYDADALGNLKHKPFLRVEGTTAIVVVGIGAVTGIASDLVHPMVNSTDTSVVHWIDTIWVEDQAGKIIGMRRLSVTEPAPATLTFQIPAGTTQMTAFEHCNKHGAFKGQMLTIDAVQTVPNLQPQCSISLCRGWTSDAAACSSPITEYERLHSSEFSRTTAVDGNTNLKHKPSLTVHGNGSATVVVGQENVKEGNITYHPMAPSTDPTLLHWINAIWVLDQSGLVIANYEFLPDAIGPASLTFEVPAGTTEMTAYEYCNKHGLFVGDETAVAGSSTSGNSEASCSATACPREVVNFAQAADCLALVADANRRQALENGRSPLAFLMPYNLGSDNEKHNPYIVLDGNVAKVVIGKGAASGDASDPVHPMVGDPSSDGANMHFIETIWVEDQSGQILSYRSLSPSEPSPATLYFDIPVGTTSVRAYEYCNIHGLFQGAAVPVTPANTRAGARSGCSPQKCIEGASVSACQAFTAELQRREGGSSAKDDPSGKHKPYLWIDGTTATIVVGQGATPGNVGGLIHPMSPSNETDLVHFISYVYAEDDLQNLVALCELLPTDPAPATCTFQVPPGINFLRPYEFCNKHGLYVGEIAQIASSVATATRQCHKRECTESQPSLSTSAFTSASIEAVYETQKASTERISSSNMCLQHRGLFSVAKSAVTETLQALIDQLTQEGDTETDTSRRLSTFAELFPSLKAAGGKWHGLPVVLEHTGVETDSLRLDLLDETQLSFSQSVLPVGQEAFVEGISTAVAAAEDLLVIEGFFGMDWGYSMHKSLGPHYTIFYTPNFTSQVVDVALCAKTHGWMGMGWLTPSHVGHLMNHTDMVMAYVKDGQAVVEDRFAKYIEEPLKDELLAGQRQDDATGLVSLNGANDLTLRAGALGSTGKEWCADSACKPGFSLVQFSRGFATGDAWDADLPVKSPKIGIIYAFASRDPTGTETAQHVMSSTGYADLQWNLECPAGTFFNLYTIECSACDKGEFRPASAPVFSCLQVPAGTYQNETGQGLPKPCPPGFSTQSVGSTDELSCVCPGPSVGSPNGLYHVHTCGDGPLVLPNKKAARCALLGQCLGCPEGMVCAGGRDLLSPSQAAQRRLQSVVPAAVQRVEDFCSSFAYSLTQACDSRTYCVAFVEDSECGHAFPQLQEGYWSSPEAPLFVIKCQTRKECLGGLPGSCASGRYGFGCGVCLPNHFKSSGGTCEQCKGDDYVIICLCVVAAFGALAGLYKYMQADISKSKLTTMTAALIIGQVAVAVQMLGTFADLSVDWIEPVKSILTFLRIFTLNLDAVKIQCYIGSDNPVNVMLANLLILPFFAGALAVITKVGHRHAAFPIYRYANTLGLVSLVSYITMCMAMFRPLHCVSQPSGIQTMATNSSIVCWQGGQHTVLVALCSIGILVYVAGIFAYVVHATLRYNTLIQSGRGLMLLERYRFLFQRFKDHGYYWGVLYLSRNLLIPFIPVIIPNSSILQILLISLVLLIYNLLHVRILPWATPAANLADIVTSVGLAVFLQVAAFMAGADRASGENVLAGLLMATVCAMMVFLLSLMGWIAYKKFRPGTRYTAFLCHHKDGAAVLCRWLKTKMLALGSGSVFLDSDELEALADIAEAVKSQSKNLVIVATKETLTRIWCAIEINSAVQNKVPIIFLACSDFDFLDDQGLDRLERQWSDQHKMNMAMNGASPENVTQSYQFLRQVPTIHFDQFAVASSQQAAVVALLAACRAKPEKRISLCPQEEDIDFNRQISKGSKSSKVSKGSDKPNVPAARILVLGSSGSAEARMTCKVLGDMVQIRKRVVVEPVFSPEEALVHIDSAEYMLVVLSPGLMMDPSFQSTLLTLERSAQHKEKVTVLTSQSFEFPSGSFFADLSSQPQGEELVVAIKEVVNILALPFSSHGSANVMSTQADEICRRFQLTEKGPSAAAAGFERNVSGSSTTSKVLELATLPASQPAAPAEGEQGADEASGLEEVQRKIQESL
ncbi:unnamed protein product [Polarella glacialis]|uniref:Tyrosine-protein kinase ephrin type A/B receptor-like domain-containing protein n=1 Tax=Polarella glacialis TaxID=89957 RepID=A0A813LF09_POLGL|nr:unnamed protein product [Polarella glacialis]